MKGKAHEMELAGTEVPGHMTLPDLQEILKMRPSPMTQNEENDEHQDDDQNKIDTFTFVAEHLVGPVLGKKSGTGTSVVNGFPQNLRRPTKPTYMSS